LPAFETLSLPGGIPRLAAPAPKGELATISGRNRPDRHVGAFSPLAIMSGKALEDRSHFNSAPVIEPLLRESA